MTNWEQQAIHFIASTGEWSKQEAVEGLLSKSIDLLRQQTGAYTALQLVIEDQYTVKVKDATPSFLNEHVMNPGPVEALLQKHVFRIIYWPDITIVENVLEDILLALSSAVIIPIDHRSADTAIVLGWSEPRVFSASFCAYLELVKSRLGEMITQFQVQQAIRQELLVYTAVLQALPQALVFIEEAGYSGWVNEMAAKLLQLPGMGNQPSSVLSAAMGKLKSMALNGDEIEQRASAIFTLPAGTGGNWIWKLELEERGQKIFNVSTLAIEQNRLKGRLWVFDELTGILG